MAENEKIVSEKIEELIESLFRFPFKYVKTTFTLLFKSKSAFEKIYNENEEGSSKEYIQPLTYFVVSYSFLQHFLIYSLQIDDINNWRIDTTNHISTDLIYSTLFDYFKVTNFDYIITYSFPILFSYYIVIWLFSKFAINKKDEILLRYKLFYFVSSLPLLPALCLSLPSIISGEPTLHGSNENGSIGDIALILFFIGFIYSFIIGVNQLNSMMKKCQSFQIGGFLLKTIFSILCFIILFIYCLSSMSINEDLKKMLLKNRDAQIEQQRKDADTEK